MVRSVSSVPESHYRYIHKQALYYVSLGLPIIPLCPASHNKMSHTHRTRCSAPGKTPLLPGWSSRETPSVEEVEEWFRKNPYINIGLVLGDTGAWNLVGVDVDGELGEKLLTEWSAGVLPVTWEFTTGNGRRLLYLLPDGAESKKFKVAEGKKSELALLAQGQQTVMPPSVHMSGKIYKWVEGRSPADIPIADAPQWLLNRVLVFPKADGEVEGTEADGEMERTGDEVKGAGREDEEESFVVKPEDWTKTVPETQRNNHLTRLAGSLIARRNIPKNEVVVFLQAWNLRHCVPPLPDDEIVRMVDSIYASEQMKALKRGTSGKRGGRRRSTLEPTPFAEVFLKKQKEKGFRWAYMVSRGLFYKCDETTGPWFPCDSLYVQKEVREMLLEENESWDKQHYVNEVVNALRELLADPEKDDVFDIGLHPDLLHVYVKNGMLDWRTLTLKPWDPSTYSTIQLPVEWDPQAARNPGYERWLRALEDWVPDEPTRMFLQEFVGYCLIPDCSYRTAVFLYGAGSNGKSLFLDVISKLFGSHITFIPLHRIADRFETAGLLDKLVNICSDIDPKYMEETSVLKALIAGDTLRGEYKHGKSFNFVPVARLMFSANALPRASDKSEGWYSRWKFVEFPKVFPVDPSYKRNLLAEMSTPGSLSALLLWAVEGLRRLYRQEGFTTGVIMKAAEMKYRAENDSVTGFADQCLQRVTHEGVKTVLASSSLYKTYRGWCEAQGLKAVSQVEFSKRLVHLGFEKGVRPIEKVSTACFLGVKFSDAAIQEYGLLEDYKLHEAVRKSSKKGGEEGEGGG